MTAMLRGWRLVATAWFALHSGSAALASPAWIVLTVSHGERDQAGVEAVVGRLIVELGGNGERVLGREEARRLIHLRASSEAARPDAELVSEIERVVEVLLLHVASNDQRLAREDVARLERLVQPSRDALDRDTRAARALQNGCLHFVRALLGRRQRDQAKDYVRQCISRFPDIEPDIHEHPPEVFGLISEVRAELLADLAALGTLRVEGDRRGCTVFLNGADVGTTPAEIAHLIPGDYRVQVECPGEPAGSGRVHRVVVAAQPTALRVDTRFDRVLRTSPALALHYRDQTEQAESWLADAQAVGRIVDASHVLAVTPTRTGTVRVDRLDAGSTRIVASVILAVNPGQVSRLGDRSEAAVQALLHGESLALDRERPLAVDPWSPVAEPARARAPRSSAVPRSVGRPDAFAGEGTTDTAALVLGAVLGVSGLSMMGAGWYFWSGDSEALVPVSFAIGGGAFTMLAVPILLPHEDHVPWWSWTAGLAGAAVAGLGAWAFAQHGSCTSRFPSGDCRITIRSADSGALLAAAALPLLEVPIVHLLQPRRGRPNTRVFLDLRERGTVVRVAGAW